MASNIFEVAFKLGGELTSSFRSAINEANKSFKGLQETGEKLQSVGKTLSMTVTAPVVAMGTAAFAAAVDFESAFAGVKKTIDSTEEGYAKLESGIREMAKTLPASASEIAAVAESAGQLGIAEESVLSFSRTIIDLGESTNMTREQAATEFARFANIVGMSQNDFDRLGSSIVGLGNTMATTESEIMSMGMRLAGQGAQVGMSESQIMALSATMSSLGIQAEAGGTAMTNILKKIQSATGAGGKELNAFAEAAGMSGKEFKQAFENDAASALDSLVKGLAVSGAEGKNLTEILDTLGIKGMYESDVLLRMSGASDLLSSALETSGVAWEENTALTDEASQRYATTAAQLSMLKNKVMDVAITVGGILIPIVLGIADKIGVWAEKFGELDENTIKTIMAIAGIAAVVGPTLIAVGTFVTSLVSIARAYRTVQTAITTFNGAQRLSTALVRAHRTAMLAYTFAGGGMRGVIAALKNGLIALNLAFLTNPFFLAAVALIALGAAFVVAYKKSETFRNIVNKTFAVVKDTVLKSIDFLRDAMSNIWAGLTVEASHVVDWAASFYGAAKAGLTTALLNIVAFVSGAASSLWGSAGDVIGAALGNNIIGGLLDSVKTGFSSLPGILSMLAPIMTTVGLSMLGVSGPIGWLIGAIVSIGGFLFRLSQTNEGVASALSSAWGAIQKTFEPVLQVFKDGFSQFANEVGPQVEETIQVIAESFAALGPAFVEVGGALVELASMTFSLFTEMRPVITSGVFAIFDVFQVVFPAIVSIVGAVIPIVAQLLMSIVPIILMIVQTVIPMILSVVQMVFPIVLSIIEAVLPVFISLLTVVIGVILQLVQTVIPLILTVIQAVLPVALAIIQAIIPIIATVLQVLVGVINGVVIPAINAILAVVQIVFPYVQMIIENALAIINGIIQAAMALLQGDWSGAWEAIKGTAITIMNNIISFFSGIDLFSVGKAIIDGLINGIKSMGGAVLGAIGSLVPAPLKSAASKLLGNLPGFAEGGIVDRTTLAWIGEGGDTEAVIPWNNSQQSKSLWFQTGEALGLLNQQGMLGDLQQRVSLQTDGIDASGIQPQDVSSDNRSRHSVVHVDYSPQYVISSPEDLDEVKQHSDQDKESLLDKIKELDRDERRLAFG